MNTKIPFNSRNEHLTGILVAKNTNQKPTILFLHGAGASSKERSLPIAEYLLEKHGIASFLFDFSGHSESSGNLGSSSLKKRVEEAKEALQFFDLTQPLSLVGSSMGGHIALELLKTYEVKNLVLLYPGIYSEEAYAIPFDNGFSDIIRKEDSWKNATVVESLESFQGKFLVVIGEKDEVIPKGVITLLEESAQKAKTKEILIIPNATHLFLASTLADSSSRIKLCKKLAEYLL